MNSCYRSLWNDKTGTFVAVSENAKSLGKKTSSCRGAGAGAGFPLKTLALSLLLSLGVNVYALPAGGVVASGSATINSGALSSTITQTSQNAAINWQSFNIASGEAVRVLQPNSSSVLLNRVLGSDPSGIFGSLSANGKVFLVNPNGILFGQGASVNVGALVASTLNIADSDFLAGNYKFSGAGAGSVLNQGAIRADGGYVALLGANVANNGVIQAKLGSVALVAGQAITLDVAGDGLLNVTVNQGAVKALVQNGGLIQADGGQVLLSAQAAGSLLQSAVNNSGVIRAQTIENRNGSIKLLGDMQSGSVNVAGTLDASAPQGGPGGFVETSAAHVNIADNTRVNTQSAQGQSGSWLIDPADFTIAATGGNISGTTLSSNLAAGAVAIQSSGGTAGGSGDINVNAPVSWSANLLTLTAARDININAVMTASGTSTLALNTATANGLDAAVAGGAVKVGMNGDGFTGRVDFPARSGAGILSINGLAYTIVDRLGASTTSTVTDLQGMKSGLATNYALGSNIDASATAGWNAGAGFVPIGTPGTPYMGRFDGLGHTITALSITPGSASAGLFGATGPALSFQNVGLVGGSVVGAAGSGGLIGTNGTGSTVSNSYNTGTVTGAAGTGGLVGDNTTGATSNSFATGNVNGAAGSGGLLGTNTTGAVSNSYATGSVIGSGAGTGGLVGSNTTGAVSKSYAAGAVTGAGAATGGLLGSNGASVVSDTYATGNVSGAGAGVGGLIGTSIGSVTTSYATGSVGGGGSQLGALVGGIAGTVTNSFWNSDTSVVAASVGGGMGMNTAQMKAQADFTSATLANGNVNPNWNFLSTWFMYEGITYPLLRPFMTPLTVTANNDSKTYNGIAYSGGNGVTYSATTNPAYLLGALTYSGGGTSVGSYTITPGGLYSNQKGYIINYANGTATINPAHLTVTADDKTRVYGAANPALSTTVSGFVNGETASTAAGYAGAGTAATTASAVTAVGTAAITAGAGSLTATNYDFPTLVNGTLTINPAPLTVTASNVSKTYGQVPTLSAFTTAGLVNGETIGSVSETSPGAAATAAVAGSPYVITPSGATGGSFLATNYTIGYANGALTVAPAALTVTASNVAKSYGQTPTLSAFTAAGLVNGETVGSVTETSPGAAATAAVAGSPYVITPSGATGGTFVPTNYTIGYVNGVLTVAPVALTVTASNVSKAYGQTPTLSGFTTAGLVNGETVGSVTETSPGAAATAPVAGSPYTITPSSATGGTFVPTNYTIGYVNGVLTVAPVALTVTASNVSKAYGQTPTLSAFTAAGLVNGETIGSVTETSPGTVATAPVAGSPYTITPSGATGGTFVPANYTLSYVNGVLTVVPAPLTVTASDVSKSYGQVPTLSAFTTAGLVNGDTVGSVTETSPGTIATAPVTGSPYPITPSNLTGGTFVPANYTIGYVNGVLTVTPAALTVTAADVSKTYGETAPLTVFTVVGLVNGETVGSITASSPGATGGAIPSSTYVITPSGASGGTFVPSNYTISYVNGALIVKKPLDQSEPDITPALVKPWVPVVVLVETPPELLTLASPPSESALVNAVTPDETPVAVPATTPEAPVPMVEPVKTPPAIYVAPHRPRKQDRN
ncbi:MAG: MBG domain-containing protein [Rhodoferax sp.]|uniref:MBG domain-containing protein n=1 Tax=Rhodoferax sp. TaxID=50421 RepID=UPI002632484E|nr:MBG domain-containing protein [Rhodoferax sp.]MDD5335186.1 MBG domain-containing protein [Rhodoferax sp.]